MTSINKLGGKYGQVFKYIEGELIIASKYPYCLSCRGVIQDFATMFPNINIVLVNGVENMRYIK